MSPMPVSVKNFVRLIFTARRYMPTHKPVASARPAQAPSSGATDSDAPRVVVQTNRDVSSPSRATARNAVMISVPGPSARAAVIFSLISLDSARAELRIQKIIMVTNPTATRLRMPLNASWALVDSSVAAKVRTAPKLAESATAASTPVQTWGRRARSPARTSVATRIETIRPASRPSRNPMSRFGTTSLHTPDTSVIADVDLAEVIRSISKLHLIREHHQVSGEIRRRLSVWSAGRRVCGWAHSPRAAPSGHHD